MVAMVSFSPGTAVLESVANQNLTWKTVLGELIDNAFDAHAKHIAVRFATNTFSIKDDGGGCVDPTVLARLGHRVAHSTTKLGRYGVGAKDALLWIGGPDSSVHVESVVAKTRRILDVNWRRLIASPDWMGPGATDEPAIDGDRGTTIAINRVVHRVPSYEELEREIGYLYSPAIKSGCQITIQRHERGAEPAPIRRYELPRFDGMPLDVKTEVNGKSIRVYVGVVPASEPNRYPGLSYVHKFRVIMGKSSRGCGSYDTSLIAGFVELGDGWTLTKNKDGLVRDERELYETVFRTIEPVLKRAEQASHILESDCLRDAVQSDLNGAIFGDADPRRKAKRSPGEGGGSAEPTGTGRKHRRARVEQDGASFGGRASSAISLRFIKGWREDTGIGDVIPGPTAVVRIYDDHPFVAALISDRDRGRAAIASIAFTMLASMRVMPEWRQGRLFVAESVPDTATRLWMEMARLLRPQVRVDGRVVTTTQAAE
jgi:hypothetical protein